MLFLPDSYIEKCLKKVVKLEPLENYESIEITNIFGRLNYANYKCEPIRETFVVHRNGKIEIIHDTNLREVNLSQNVTEDFICDSYNFLDRGGLFIENMKKVGGYSSSIKFRTYENYEKAIPAGLVFKGIFEESFESHIQNKVELLIRELEDG